MKHWLYLTFLLGWTLPIIGIQWVIGWRHLWRERNKWPWIILGLSIYFTLADSIAITQHIWFFNPALITGWSIGNVPIEEVLFYLLTVTMIVQGFVLAITIRIPLLKIAQCCIHKK
jgi:lycopene cyclase domain-containing protein